MKKIRFNDRYGLTQAVIEGRKTMMRREVKINSSPSGVSVRLLGGRSHIVDYRGYTLGSKKLPYQIDEVVAVAQSYEDAGVWPLTGTGIYLDRYGEYRPRVAIYSKGWSNKMYVQSDLMPHQIRITGIKCERLQAISDEDCMREGVFYAKEMATPNPYGIINKYGSFEGLGETPRKAFAFLIDKVSGNGTWDRNPWVIVYEFELVK